MPAQHIARYSETTEEIPAPLSRILSSRGEMGLMERAEWDGHSWRGSDLAVPSHSSGGERVTGGALCFVEG